MIKLWSDKIPGYNPVNGTEVPGMVPYILNDGKKHGAVIVCPGGGYSLRAPHEAEPVALWLNSIGISAFVLHYRVAPYKHPFPLTDALRAIRYIRFHADQWNIDRVGILGFSAGGHLGSTVATHFDYGCMDSADPIDGLAQDLTQLSSATLSSALVNSGITVPW